MSEKENIKKDTKNIKKKAVKGKDAKLKAKIAELETKLQEAEDKILRTHAEYDNYRKRSFREIADARAYVKADTLTPVLNVFDHFKMAVTAAEQTDDMNVIREGMKMINNEFVKAMEEFGVEEINAVGKVFDPKIHEAVAKEPSDDVEEDVVIKQWRCGYKLGERLLRPATVVVSTGQECDEPEDKKEIEIETDDSE
jgi:molecular chaperone GrpE